MLDRAVKTGDPGMLGRCRYFETGCKFGDNRKCGCELLNPVKTGIADAVEISYDPEFTRLLENERDRSENLGVYHVFHLISPRAPAGRVSQGALRQGPGQEGFRVSFLECCEQAC